MGRPERLERHVAVSRSYMNAALPHEIGHTFGIKHSKWEEKIFSLNHTQANNNENTYTKKNAKLLTERRFAYAAHSPIDTCSNGMANKQCQADEVYKACQLNDTVFGLQRKLDAYLKASSGLECACKCDQYTFCHSWSFSNVHKFCWLRGVDQSTTQFKSPDDNDFVSGLKSCIKRTPGTCDVPGRARLGSILKKFKIDKKDKNICSEKCMENEACVAWNYWTGDKGRQCKKQTF